MRWATYVSPRDGQDHIGVVVDGVLHGFREAKELISLLADDAALAMAAPRPNVNCVWPLNCTNSEIMLAFQAPPLAVNRPVTR